MASFIGQTIFAHQKVAQWLISEDEAVGRVGWSLLKSLARNDQALSDSYFEKYLWQIEQRIHSSPNRLKEAMNQALIAIGVRNEVLQEKAEAVARRIGKVEVDHGETDCKTPDAIAYIRKTIAKTEKDKVVKAR